MKEEAKAKEMENQNNPNNKHPQNKAKEENKLREKIAKLVADSEHWKNEYYRAYADMKNLRDSIEKDHREVLKYRSMGFLENEGVSEVSPKVGDKFDPNSMSALETQYDEGEPNRVLKVNVNGYKLHDRLIRPAIVVVSTNKKDENKEENKNEGASNMDA